MKKKTITANLAILVAMLLIVSGVSYAILNFAGEQERTIDNNQSKGDIIEEMKQEMGVRDPDKNYNEIINGHGTGYAPPTEEQYEYLEGRVNTVGEGTYTTGGWYEELPRSPNQPSSYDLTDDSFYPPCGDQGSQGSCAAFASTYTQLTYRMAQDYGQNVNTFGSEIASSSNNPTHSDYIMSPAWSYNHANDGGDNGCNWFGTWGLSSTVGNSNWATMPYDQNDATSWGSETANRNAAKFQSTNWTWMDCTQNSSAVDWIKHWVSQDRPVGFIIDGNNYPYWGFGDDVASSQEWGSGTSPNHAQTIVGYDDSKSDSDGSGETGAFLVQNSWGDWGPYQGSQKGTYWMTYTAYMNRPMNDPNYAPYAYYLSDPGRYDSTTSNSPKLLATWDFSTQGGRDPTIKASISNEDGGKPVTETRKPKWDGSSGTMNDYPPFLSLDITSFMDEWNQGSGANYFSLYTGDTSGSTSTINHYFVEYYGSGYDDSGSGYTDISIDSPDAPASNPCTMWTTFAYPDGKVMFNQTKYAVEDSAGIKVEDSNLTGNSNVDVDVVSDTEPSGETLTLSVDSKYPHVFTGSIPLSATDSSGVLQVSGGDTITVTYADASHGDKTDTATIDTSKPVVTSGPTESPKLGALIEWTSDELANSKVNYGTTTSLGNTATVSDYVTDHRVCIDGLNSDEPTYYYEIVMTNEAGLTTVDDNGGSYYTFTPNTMDNVEEGNVSWTELPNGGRSNNRWQVWSDTTYSGSYSWNIGNGQYDCTWCDNLTSPVIDVSGWSNCEWTWYHEYSIESGWDGGVVEVSVDGGSWQRVTPQSGYDGQISTDAPTPISGDQAFTGSSNGWDPETVDLSTYMPASTIQVKYYFNSDHYVTDVGWNVDDIEIRNPTGAPTISITQPNGGETLQWDVDYEIQWSTSPGGGSITGVDLDYSTDGGTSWVDIVNGTTDDGSYMWDTPNVWSTDCLVRGIVHDDQGSTGQDESDSTFTIEGSQPPSITVTQPNFGESWHPGKTYNITWSTTAGDGSITGVDLKYTSDGGSTWTDITTGTADDGVYEWFVPKVSNAPSDVCLVNATVHDSYNMSGSDESDGYFTIEDLTEPVIYVTYPNGGETLNIGQKYNITWDIQYNDYHDKSYATVNLDYSTDGGSTWKNIKDGVSAEDLSYEWTVPNDPSTNCLMIANLSAHNSTFNDYVGVNDTSNSTWEIGSSYVVHDLGTLSSGGQGGGWNFVSFNIEANGDNYASANDLVEILEDSEYGISGSYDKAMYYDSSNDDWKTYVPSRAAKYNDLSSWNRYRGVWIHMTSDDNLQVEGTSYSSTDITLQPGWNMVSYPSDTAGNNGLPAEVSRIGYYDSSAQYNLAYETADPQSFSFTPSEGYWIYNDADTTVTWTVNY